jgi:hypothetical protein
MERWNPPSQPPLWLALDKSDLALIGHPSRQNIARPSGESRLDRKFSPGSHYFPVETFFDDVRRASTFVHDLKKQPFPLNVDKYAADSLSNGD